MYKHTLSHTHGRVLGFTREETHGGRGKHTYTRIYVHMNVDRHTQIHIQTHTFTHTWTSAWIHKGRDTRRERETQTHIHTRIFLD